MVATPCPLILAVPVAVISAINRAAGTGIIVKGGTALEQIAGARAFVFDKTGTLTLGTPVVEAVIPFDGLTPREILRAAGSVEQLSSHLLLDEPGRMVRSSSPGLELQIFGKASMERFTSTANKA